jgi:hypothetical protein
VENFHDFVSFGHCVQGRKLVSESRDWMARPSVGRIRGVIFWQGVYRLLLFWTLHVVVLVLVLDIVPWAKILTAVPFIPE